MGVLEKTKSTNSKNIIVAIFILTIIIVGFLGIRFSGIFGNISKNQSVSQKMLATNIQNEAPRMHVNANNKGIGVAGIKIPIMLSSVIHADYEKNILPVNPSNEIKLSFEGKPKVLSIKITQNELPSDENAISGDEFNAPKEFGVKLYEAEVQFEGVKYYYPFKIDITAENQKQLRFGDIHPEKIIKLDITKIDRASQG